MDIRIFEKFLRGNFAILGIGNTMRGDDGFGSIVATELKKIFSGNILGKKIFDGGIAPENFLGKIAKLGIEKLLIIDAVIFDGKPGELRIFAPGDFSKKISLTHGPTNFEMFEKFLPECEIIILAAVPKNLSLGQEISYEMQLAIKKTIEIVCKSIPIS